MTLPNRETDKRALLGLVYPTDDGKIRLVDRYALLGLVYVPGFNGAISASLSFAPAIAAKGRVEAAVLGVVVAKPVRA